MGGIGQAICRRLAELGARNLILISRNAEQKTANSQIFIEEFQDRGCRLYIRNCDATSRNSLSALISEAECELPPVKGIIQAAMVLRDMSFHRMGLADYMAAVRPKVYGTWNLHSIFASRPLSFFIVLSSFVGIGGNPGQANYAAGGAFEDAVSRHRSSRCLPSITIDLGAVKGIGYLVDHQDVANRLADKGFQALSEEKVLDIVEASIEEPRRDVDASQLVVGISGSDWSCMPGQNDLRFERFKSVSSTDNTAKEIKIDRGINLRTELMDAKTSSQASEIVLTALRWKIAAMFSIEECEIETTAPLSRYGVDSLIAAELRNWLSISTKATISIFDIIDSPSISELATKVAIKR